MKSVVWVTAAVAATSLIGVAPALASGDSSALSTAVAKSVTKTAASRPRIVSDPIPYGPKRKRQMAGYAWRHYHLRTYKLTNVRQIVLHYTGSNSYSSVHNFFSSSAAGLGPSGTKPEHPANCTHFVIGKGGVIYQQAPLEIMCRQAIGLNHRSIGIEFVESSSARNILRRPKQLRAGLALVSWLQSRYSVPKSDVIGHSMVNKSRFFVDYEGWKNDHTDWRASQVKVFRKRLH